MATQDEMSTQDLLRLFLLKFLSDTELTAYANGTYANGNAVDSDGTAINTKTEA